MTTTFGSTVLCYDDSASTALFRSARFTNGTDFSLESVDENDDSSSDELQDAESRFTAAGT